MGVCVRVGVHSVAYAFPKVHLVTTAVDPDINDQFYILPGIGKYHYREVIKYVFCMYVHCIL